MKWFYASSVKEPGMYLCRLDNTLPGNSWLSMIEMNDLGVYFLNAWGGKHDQKLHCPGNKKLLLFGPIPV